MTSLGMNPHFVLAKPTPSQAAVLAVRVLLMNFEPTFAAAQEAKVRYLDADFQVMRHGDYVRCAVTRQAIRLEDLRYWSVERQEAYASAEVAMQRHLEMIEID